MPIDKQKSDSSSRVNSQLPSSDFQLRSEEVQEILTRVPHWLIRWGSLVVLMIFMLLIFLSWLIKYPDIISSQISITTNIPPQKLMAKTSGRIEAILVNNKATVAKNAPLAVIENTANYKDVFLLTSIVESFDANKNSFPFEKLNEAQLGEIESSFALFQKEYSINNLNSNLKPYQVEGDAQSYEAIQLKERLSLLESQKQITQSELELQKNDLDRYEALFKKGIIASQEIERERLKYLQSQKNFKGVLSTISQLKSSINDLNRNSKTTRINESKENSNLERNVLQAFFQLKKAIKEWELNYVLQSDIEGQINFLQIWSVNQTVNSGDEVFVVVPTNRNNYIGKVKASAQNSGKIRVGQEVNIRLANYPDVEFGVLKGKIQSISDTADKDGNLLLDVSLPNGLETSYKKKINFRQEMVGSADIITEDLRLIERLLYQFRGIFNR